MYTLSENGYLPKSFNKVSKRKIPYWPVMAIILGILLGSLINYALPLFFKSAADMFVLVFGASVLPGMVPWFVILISHLGFIKRHEEELVDHPFRLPGAPWINYVALVLLVAIVIFMFFNPETRASIMIGLGFEILMIVIYLIKYRKSDAK